jgi:hypothetical protein
MTSIGNVELNSDIVNEFNSCGLVGLSYNDVVSDPLSYVDACDSILENKY